MDAAMVQNGPPYPSVTAALGLTPNTSVDVPICCVFLVLYLIAAASHMTIFQINRIRKHKFIPNAATFGFCMARSLTCALRISWAYNLDNVQLAIAAAIFANAGVLVLFVLLLIFAQRCLRAAFPKLGWSRLVHYIFIGAYILVPCMLVMLIVPSIYMHYTLSTSSLDASRDALLVGLTYLSFFSFLPLAITITLAVLPRASNSENFGTGSWAAKLWIVGISSFLLCLGEVFRTAVNFMPERLASDPYSFEDRACFYIFYFTVEIIVVYTFLFTRIDKRFWIPNGSKGTYSAGSLEEELSSELGKPEAV
ncbi:hypothetical protein UA08_02288 [Talaromyces atroroseus]|uniref:Uncharacterized protein n=1 Tax=Talaromyces atroroseus TaxID=1441469 RepID=A0A225AVD5_TALAT|nr:hypothetical protein UA08_02288 [Talaromyces atroroseus]OKL62334.1 hypothetical protein UA08_02288 [Talaromyces atroroseus]